MNQSNSFKSEVVETRCMMQKSEHLALLVWGWTTALVAAAVYVVSLFSDSSIIRFAWIAVPVIAISLQLFFGKPDGLANPTALFRMLSAVSRMIIVVLMVVTIGSAWFDYPTYFIVVLLLAIWCGFTAFMLDYKRLVGPCVGGVVIALAILCVPARSAVAVFAAGIVATLIVPGYILRSDSRR